MKSDDLRGIALFEGLTDEQLEASAALCLEVRALMGDHLTDESDFGYSFYIVIDGHVVVKVGDKVVADLRGGDHFGEVSLIEHERRNATVVAAETCHVAKVMTWDFDKFLDVSPLLRERLSATAAGRHNEEE
ncbi:MAG: cyclic nucleotide-binding domain-containing protein [Acidimicrobiales bacterium]|nr:cyclic nucleotide-binding domain-containing protein [Acidimicrobiales bacterium]